MPEESMNIFLYDLGVRNSLTQKKKKRKLKKIIHFIIQ